jgi:hypothetical protein
MDYIWGGEGGKRRRREEERSERARESVRGWDAGEGKFDLPSCRSSSGLLYLTTFTAFTTSTTLLSDDVYLTTLLGAKTPTNAGRYRIDGEAAGGTDIDAIE